MAGAPRRCRRFNSRSSPPSQPSPPHFVAGAVVATLVDMPVIGMPVVAMPEDVEALTCHPDEVDGCSATNARASFATKNPATAG